MWFWTWGLELASWRWSPRKRGRRRFTPLDATDIAEVARDLVKSNDLANQVQVLHGRADELELDQKVDLIVSEWLGNAAFVEGMLHAVLDARDRHLTPNGRMLPAKVRVLIAPLDDPILYNTEGPGFWRAPIQGLDFSRLQDVELSQGRTMQNRIEPAAVLAPGRKMLELDLLETSIDDVWSEGELEFVPLRDGVLNAFCVWFVAELSPGVTLDTGPFSPETHWSQTYLSFMTLPVQAGQPLSVNYNFSYNSDPEAIHRYVDLHLAVGDHELSFLID